MRWIPLCRGDGSDRSCKSSSGVICSCRRTIEYRSSRPSLWLSCRRRWAQAAATDPSLQPALLPTFRVTPAAIHASFVISFPMLHTDTCTRCNKTTHRRGNPVLSNNVPFWGCYSRNCGFFATSPCLCVHSTISWLVH